MIFILYDLYAGATFLGTRGACPARIPVAPPDTPFLRRLRAVCGIDAVGAQILSRTGTSPGLSREPHLPLALAFAVFLLPIPFLALTLNHLKRQLGILTSGPEDIYYGLLFPICLILYGIAFFILYVIAIKDIPFFLPIW